MTPDMKARAGYRRPQVGRADSGTAIGSGRLAAEAARANSLPRRDAPPYPAGWMPRAALSASSGRLSGTAARPRAVERAARRAREDASIVKVVPLLAVLVVTVAGVYIAWGKGSAGGGEGGVVGGAALLTAAVARLLLPASLAGLLGTRKRAIDVITLTVLGVSLLVAGLVLPR